MEKMILLFEEFIMKAITLTEGALATDPNEAHKFEAFTDNRDRLFQIIEQIQLQIDWNQVSDDKKNDLSRQIDFIKKLDEKLLVKLQEHQIQMRKEIEKTFRQKENIKGYNLNDVK